MTPVMQTRHNNCVAACVASLFDLPIVEIPDITPFGWDDQLQLWLLPLGMALVNIKFNESIEVPPIKGYCLGAIAAGSAFPDGYKHCVVCKDGLIYFDPCKGFVTHPKRAEEYTIIYLLNPGTTA